MKTSYGENPNRFPALNTLSPCPKRICDANPDLQMHMNTHRMSITPKVIQDLLDELEGQSKAGCAL
jgi:hypothetical protein